MIYWNTFQAEKQLAITFFTLGALSDNDTKIRSGATLSSIKGSHEGGIMNHFTR